LFIALSDNKNSKGGAGMNPTKGFLNVSKRWSYVSLFVCLTFLLSACGGAASPPPAAQVNPTAASSEAGSSEAGSSEAAPTSAPEAAETAAELPKIVVYANNGAMGRGRPEGSDPARLKEVHDLIAQEVGVDVQAILPPSASSADALQKLNLMLSSPSEQLDLFQGNWTEFQEIALPLDDLLQQHGQDILKAWPEEVWQRMKDSQGRTMAIPRNGFTAPHPVWVRSDLLESLNLSAPTTIDEFEAYLEAHKQSDPTAIPLISTLSGLRMAFVAGYTEHGYSNWLDASDNKIKPPELQPGFQDWVAKMADWYAKGYIYADTLGTTDANILRETLKTQKVGASSAWYSVVTLGLPAVQDVNPDIKMEAVFLTGPMGIAQTVDVSGAASSLIVSKRAPNPEAVIKFINWQYANIENHLTADRGIQGKDWEFVDQPELVKDMQPGTQVIKSDDYRNTGYVGEFAWSLGLPNETRYAILTSNGSITQHAQWLNCCQGDTSKGKMPFASHVSYDNRQLIRTFPNLTDFNRLMEEETIKFISGSRPLSEWGAFVDQVNAAGLEQWSQAYTEQYQASGKE
jgi:putative aldouronate transport system substrate-binding protein